MAQMALVELCESPLDFLERVSLDGNKHVWKLVALCLLWRTPHSTIMITSAARTFETEGATKMQAHSRQDIIVVKACP